MKPIFEKMQSEETRTSFVSRRGLHMNQNNEEFKRLSNYILSEECVKDIERLKTGDYYFDYPQRFKIKKISSSRRRICYKFSEKDALLLKLASYCLLDYDYLYQPSVYSFRRNYNHENFFEKLKNVDYSRRFYVLKMDIHAYGESVDQDILLEKAKIIFKEDPTFYNFLNWLLKRNAFYEKGELVKEKVSIIPGTPIGSFLNNIYLLDIDEYIIKHSILSMRYTDDIAVFLKTEEEAIQMRDYILDELGKLKLSCNPEKTEIFRPKEEFSILGIKVSPFEFDIAPGSVKKLLFKMTKKRDKLLRKVREKRFSLDVAYDIGYKFIYHLLHGYEDDENVTNWCAWTFGIITTDNSLKFLDNNIAQILRTLKSGKINRARFRIKYDNLKATGYKSLVNEYHNYKDEEEKNGTN